jgi:SGNH hydrolase-like domain, acetyltransferase AlgX
MKLNKKQAAFSIILVLLVTGVLEITLHLLAFVSPRVAQILGTSHPVPPTVPDERLGYRPNPALPGHDRLGFRNPTVPATAHIVALGDSQTYGTHVKPEDAWPRQLELMTGKIVYSMAFGGYGPPASLILWDEAMALEPHIVIEAFYAGNDLFDLFDMVYNRGQLPALKSSDPQVQARIRAAERSELITKHVSQMDQHTFGVRRGTPEEESNALLHRFLVQHSTIYGFWRRTWHEFMDLVNTSTRSTYRITQEENWETVKAFAEAHPAYCQVFHNGPFKTVFTSEYRLAALKLADPRIAEGLQISLRVMQKMHEEAIARNRRFLVVLIPTKETVFRKLWPNPSMSYRSLTEHEERLWRTTKALLEQNGIEYLDALPALQEQLVAGIQPYPVSNDGHPNQHGHRAIAQLVAASLRAEPAKSEAK